MATASQKPFYFDGFEQSNTTPVPDVLFDELLPHLGYAELKVLLYIIRRTRGFKKHTDPISFNQFLRGITTRDGRVLDRGCGIKDRTSLSQALKSLEKQGIVVSSKGVDERGENETTVYSIRWKGDSGNGAVSEASRLSTMEESGGVVGKPYHPSRAALPPVVGKPYQQETVIQQTEIQDRDSRSAASSQRNNKPRQRAPAPLPLATLLTDTQTLLTNHKTNRFSKTPPPEVDAAIRDVSIKLRDEPHLRENLSQAANLYHAWGGVTGGAFVAYVYEACSITRQQTAVKKQMPYFFQVLKGLLGLADDEQGSIAPG